METLQRRERNCKNILSTFLQADAINKFFVQTEWASRTSYLPIFFFKQILIYLYQIVKYIYQISTNYYLEDTF